MRSSRVAAETSRHIPLIRALCEEFGVVRLEVFDLPPGDEPGFLVTFIKGNDDRGVRGLVEMEVRLSAILGRDVTLLTVAVLRNAWLRTEAWGTRSTLYEAPARYPYASASAQGSNQLGDEPVMVHDQGRNA